MPSSAQIVYLLLLGAITFCASIKVKTKLGELEGTERKSRDGNIYYAFTKVPYAKPPDGKLRLKNPVPIDPWSSVLEAKEESPACLQVEAFFPSTRGQISGQVDCLYLSIYTPDLKPKEKLPVMIQMHGGGFRCGNAGPKDNPDYLLDGGVILVNVHYRVGTLGFLSTENSVIPGNFGLKDQSMAVQWVHTNIDAFGGDPERITLFGESAGGASTHFHMISPLTKGYIKGAISQSGVVNEIWGFAAPGQSRPLVERVAEIVGCHWKTDEDMLNCLQNVDPVELIKSEKNFLYWDFEPSIVFRPTQEPNAPGAFLPFDPLKQETTLPWMTGIVSSEGILRSASLLAQNEAVTQQFIDHEDEYIMKMMYLNESHPKTKATIKLIKDRYFPEPLTIKSAIDGNKDFFSDLMFIYPLALALGRHKGPVYLYNFDYRGANSLTDFYGDFGNIGVCHGDDLIYLFNWKDSLPKSNPGDENVSRIMVNLWTNFAKYQKPTTEHDLVQWPKHDSAGHYLDIASELKVKRHLCSDIVDWWHKLPTNAEATWKGEL